MTKTRKTTAKRELETSSALPTFADHIQELRSRLFFVALAFVVAAGLAYPFFEHIVSVLTRPLGGTELYYLTPAGGLSFIIKVCMYVGFIGMLPVAVYQLYRFISPIMKKRNTKAILLYTLASTFLALAGVAFAYFVSLPAAIHFLTGIELMDIKAMLTIDSYMSFVGAYLLAGALLFQLPLILLLINSVTPTPPSALMRYQKHIIVGAFIFAAVVSPTPDAINQLILALPIIVTYQVGILAVWLRQRNQRKNARRLAARQAKMTGIETIKYDASLIGKKVVSLLLEPGVSAQSSAAPRTRVARRNIDVVLTNGQEATQTIVQPKISRPVVSTSAPRQSIDGFFVSSPAAV